MSIYEKYSKYLLLGVVSGTIAKKSFYKLFVFEYITYLDMCISTEQFSTVAVCVYIFIYIL